MVDISQYKVGVLVSLETCGNAKSGGKPLKACKVDIGDTNNGPITVVTSASNVREGSRVAVALAGSTVIDEEGEEMMLKKTSVGGVLSEGMFCDSRMLGWSGGAAGVAVQIPDDFKIGSPPPSSKPRPGQQQQEPSAPASDAPGLFEKKLTKEEKKKLAEERRKARKAAKEAKKKEEA